MSSFIVSDVQDVELRGASKDRGSLHLVVTTKAFDGPTRTYLFFNDLPAPLYDKFLSAFGNKDLPASPLAPVEPSAPAPAEEEVHAPQPAAA